MFMGAPPPPPAPFLSTPLPPTQINGNLAIKPSNVPISRLLPPPPPPPSLPVVEKKINKSNREFSKHLISQTPSGIFQNDYNVFDSPLTSSFVCFFSNFKLIFLAPAI